MTNEEQWVSLIIDYLMAVERKASGSVLIPMVKELGQTALSMPLHPSGNTWQGIAERVAGGKVSSRTDPVINEAGVFANYAAQWGHEWANATWGYVVLKYMDQIWTDGITAGLSWNSVQHGKRYIKFFSPSLTVKEIIDNPQTLSWQVWKARINRKSMVPWVWSIGIGVVKTNVLELAPLPPLRLIEKVEP